LALKKKDQYTPVPNFGFEKKRAKIPFFSMKNVTKNSAIARSLDDFSTHYEKYLNLKRVYKKRCVSLRNLQNFNWFLPKF
jgi:hypothetical protein